MLGVLSGKRNQTGYILSVLPPIVTSCAVYLRACASSALTRTPSTSPPVTMFPTVSVVAVTPSICSVPMNVTSVCAVGDSDGLTLGEVLGETLGLVEGDVLGDTDGDTVGAGVGSLGDSDGDCDGDTLGDTLGLVLGLALGEMLGLELGLVDGLSLG